ncbi:MAG: type II toxin-antitoxin system VapC family toxin [Actinomycetota bacterium]
MADASALVEYLLRTEVAVSLEPAVRGSDADLHVPALCDVEVAAGLRRGLIRGALSEERLAQAVEDYLDLPLTRHGHQHLLSRMLNLRENFSAYDATYVALAEQLDGELLTADEGLARAARMHTGVAILAL